MTHGPSTRVSSFHRSIFVVAILALAALFTAVSVDESVARLGGGGSFGNRGTRTYSMPPSTSTSPRSSIIPGQGYGQNSFGQSGFGRSGGFMSGGFGRGLLGGLVGAGLVGMLFGNGFGGGLGGMSSLIGLVIQLGLLYLLFRFVMGFFANRRPAMSGAGFGQSAPTGFGGAFGGGGANAMPQSTPITIEPADYAVFEQRLAETQALYSAEDIAGLRRLATQDMVAHFASDLAGNNSRGQVNRLSDVRLLQGDLSEAWRESGSDFATVAMKFSLNDVMIERSSGRVVGGNATVPQVVTELWTFTRPAGTGANAWLLSAIQQG